MRIKCSKDAQRNSVESFGGGGGKGGGASTLCCTCGSKDHLPSVMRDNNNGQGNKPATTAGDDANLLKGISWSPDVFVEKETLLVLYGTFGGCFGESLECS